MTVALADVAFVGLALVLALGFGPGLFLLPFPSRAPGLWLVLGLGVFGFCSIAGLP